MSVKTNYGEYPVGDKDSLDKFHGNQLVYIGWDDHLSFCSANAYPFPPAMPFGALTAEVLPSIHAIHPDFSSIDWATVEWTLDGERFNPDMDKSLADNGVGHKSLIQFKTPNLNGYKNSGC